MTDYTEGAIEGTVHRFLLPEEFARLKASNPAVAYGTSPSGRYDSTAKKRFERFASYGAGDIIIVGLQETGETMMARVMGQLRAQRGKGRRRPQYGYYLILMPDALDGKPPSDVK